jgi:hypothetical protein
MSLLHLWIKIMLINLEIQSVKFIVLPAFRIITAKAVQYASGPVGSAELGQWI